MEKENTLDPDNERKFQSGIEAFRECVELLKKTTKNVQILNDEVRIVENLNIIHCKATISYFHLNPELDRNEWELSEEIMNKTETGNINDKNKIGILKTLLEKAERL
ncbi:MAG: hypothetical protein ACOC56_05820 [Atribacterota bacterium]